MEKDVVVLIGAGSIGIACARRIATGKHLIIGDINSKTAKKIYIMLVLKLVVYKLI